MLLTQWQLFPEGERLPPRSWKEPLLYLPPQWEVTAIVPAALKSLQRMRPRPLVAKSFPLSRNPPGGAASADK